MRPLTARPRSDFSADPYLRDIVERNLEIAAQCCLDISHRIISLENARKPSNYYEAILILSELDILPAEFAQEFAPIAGFRNILVREYIQVDWDLVYKNLQQIGDLEHFSVFIRDWLQNPRGESA